MVVANAGETLEQQHADVSIRVDRLELLSRSNLDTLPDERWRAVMQHEATRLRTALRAHFAFEERGGFMKSVIERHPNQDRDAKRLLEQHDRILEGFDELLDLLVKPSPREAIELKVGLLVEQLRTHERTETRFLQEGILRDQGSGD